MTTVNATETELRAVAEVLKLAAILDDRAPAADRARIAAWAEQIHRHRLAETDLLDGLQPFYDSPSERSIAIGDLIHHARHAKRSRLDKEAEREREQRQATLDVKAADEVHAVTSLIISSPTGPTVKTKRLIAAENGLQTCVDKQTAQDAIREYFAAKTEARKATLSRAVAGMPGVNTPPATNASSAAALNTATPKPPTPKP